MLRLDGLLAKHTRPNLLCLALSMNICLGSFILGYEFSVYSPCQSSVSYANNWLNTPDEHFIHGVLNASLPFGVMLGILLSAALFRLPRRRLFLCNDLVTIVAIGITLGQGFNQLFLGRLLLGVTQGVNSVFIPIYIEQMANHQVKGLCGSLNFCFYQAGFLFSFFMGYILPTKAQLEKEAGGRSNVYLFVLSWPMFLSFLRLVNLASLFPFDTPEDYFRRGQPGQAQKVLVLTQNHLPTDRPIGQASSLSFRPLFSAQYLPQLLLGMFYATLQALCGVNAVIYYCQRFFLALSDKYSNLLILLVGVILVVSALVCGNLVDTFGRKKVTLAGLVMCTVALGGLSVKDTLQLQWVLVPLIYLFTLGYGLSLGPVFSIYISEILPMAGVWLVVLVNWFVSIWVGLFFFKLDHLYGPQKVFGLFAGFDLIGLLLLYAFMLETKGKTEEQILLEFSPWAYRPLGKEQ